jgi:hypothetical protein
MRRLFASFACAAALWACQTAPHDSGAPSEGLAAAVPPARDEPQGPNPETDAAPRAYPLGKLEDDAVRQLLYEALVRRVNRTGDVGDGQTETSELGEVETFEFNVIKTVRDGVEIDGNEAANRIDIEVRGWYRRSLTGGEASTQPVCSSFDTMATIVYRSGAWKLEDGQELAFTREDQEDCY